MKKLILALAIAFNVGCTDTSAHTKKTTASDTRIVGVQMVDNTNGFATVKLQDFEVSVMFDADPSLKYIDHLAIISIYKDGESYSDFTDAQDHQAINRLLLAELGGVK
jgi:hypothetical protein